MKKHIVMGTAHTHIKFASGSMYTLEPAEDIQFNQYYITVIHADGRHTLYPHSCIACVSWNNPPNEVSNG